MRLLNTISTRLLQPEDISSVLENDTITIEESDP